MNTYASVPDGTWPDRAARGYAILRAVMVGVFSAALILAPEKMMPGSSVEPARSLALVFSSRSILLGVAFLTLAMARKRKELAWVLFADAVLQVFDSGLSLAMQKGIVSLVPVALGVLDLWAGRVLLRVRLTSVG